MSQGKNIDFSYIIKVLIDKFYVRPYIETVLLMMENKVIN